MINIHEKHNCCGCGACAAGCPKRCISMQEDEEGFLYPVVDTDKCIDCGLCTRVCPMIRRETGNGDETRIYAAYAKNRESIFRSSSGGVFSELAKWTLRQEGVVYGAAYGENMAVLHQRAVTWEQCRPFRGSKYVQSRMDHLFTEIKKDLGHKKYVLFTGTPCQVSALRNYLHKDSPHLLTCDLICHAVPSPALFSKYIAHLETTHGGRKVAFINMKDKTRGWKNPTVSVTLEDGTVLADTEDTRLWTDLFYSHLPIRPSCHHCPFCSPNRPGDITLGDYWGIERSHPEFENAEGTSLVFINTPKGKAAFEDIQEQIAWRPSSLKEAMQPSLAAPVKERRRRKQFFKDASRLPIRKLHQKYIRMNRLQQIYILCARLKSRIRAAWKKQA